MGKKYREPKIKIIELSPDQAILNVCQVGGGYMSGPTGRSSSYCMNSGVVGTCKVTIRGRSRMGPGGTTMDAMPS